MTCVGSDTWLRAPAVSYLTALCTRNGELHRWLQLYWPRLEEGWFEAFGILIPAIGGMLFFLNVPTIVALCTTQAVAKGLRMYLISTLVSGLLLSLSSIVLGLVVLVLVFSGAPVPPPLLFRFLIWMLNIGSTARCFSLINSADCSMIWKEEHKGPLHHTIPVHCLGCVANS